MLHYTERKNRIRIITLDNVLAQDICERLVDYPGTNTAELILPAAGKEIITADEILKSAHDTTDSRILIMDVRSQTKPPLQRAHSDIVRFNRPDLNKYCFTVLIGDGPASFLLQSKGINAFQNYLGELRNDYNPAVFFGNPFIYYTHEELLELAMYHENALPEKVPQRLEKYFKTGISIKAVYEYFRATGDVGDEKFKKRKKRLKKLKDIYTKMIAEDFQNDIERIEKALSQQGCDFPGETLRLNTYPFHFEEWIADLLIKAQNAA